MLAAGATLAPCADRHRGNISRLAVRVLPPARGTSFLRSTFSILILCRRVIPLISNTKTPTPTFYYQDSSRRCQTFSWIPIETGTHQSNCGALNGGSRSSSWQRYILLLLPQPVKYSINMLFLYRETKSITWELTRRPFSLGCW